MTYEQKLKQVEGSTPVEYQFIEQCKTFSELFTFMYHKGIINLILEKLKEKKDFSIDEQLYFFLCDFRTLKVQLHKKYINDKSINYNKFDVVEDKEDGLFFGYYIKGDEQIDQEIKDLALKQLNRYIKLFQKLKKENTTIVY